MDLTNLRTILIDGDGVLWRSTEAVPGLNTFFETLEKRGIRWALLTNNNTRTVDEYVEKLRGFGINANRRHVYSSVTATISYLKGRYGAGAALHVVGMPSLIDSLEKAGFELSTGEQAPTHPVKAVVAGMDRALNYEKVKVAMRLILGGAEFVATNTDGSFPTPEGLFPGTGMVIGALQATTDIAPTVIGKPERAIFEAAIQGLHADPESTAMLGDRLETDILGGQRAGITTILVLTGVTTPAYLEKSQIKPDYVYQSIAELAADLMAVMMS